MVIYDSVFGNTEKIALAIGDALAAVGEVKTIPVGRVNAAQLLGLNVLIVGSPTRGFKPTQAITQFLNDLPNNHFSGVQAASFDTRIALETIKQSAFRFIVDKGGYAARVIARSLEKKGGKLILPPEGFFVLGEQGPLKDGELERAARWAERISSLLEL